MYSVADYVVRGCVFLNNQIRPTNKKLASLMIYATDLCDSACKHCLIWAKRPASILPTEQIIKLVKSTSVNKFTKIGLEGGEFLLHPEALEILKWFKANHPNFDLLSNCLQPDKLVNAVRMYKPQRLWVSLDGTEETYKSMRGKDGYDKVIYVIEQLKEIVPISLMFTLSPYNDFADLQHVTTIASKYEVDLRVGIYNNIDFFDTLDKAHTSAIGSQKGEESLTFKNLRNKIGQKPDFEIVEEDLNKFESWKNSIPDSIKGFDENYDFILLYNLWKQQELRLRCFSIFDNVIVLPNGDIPICQNLPTKLGNIYEATLDDILNSAATVKTQKFHSHNCNSCWINYHRKQDVVLYRNMERIFGRKAVSKVLGYYQWNEHQDSYKQIVE